MWLEALLRLKINMDKGELISIGGVANVADLAMELGCKVGEFSSTHLGLPLGALSN